MKIKLFFQEREKERDEKEMEAKKCERINKMETNKKPF